MPAIDGFEEAFFAQRDHHVVVVEAVFGRAIAHLDEESRQVGNDIVAFAADELFAKGVVPDLIAQLEVQLVGEEEVQTLFGILRETILEALEEVLDIPFARQRMHRVKRRLPGRGVDGQGDPLSLGSVPRQ